MNRNSKFHQKTPSFYGPNQIHSMHNFHQNWMPYKYSSRIIVSSALCEKSLASVNISCEYIRKPAFFHTNQATCFQNHLATLFKRKGTFVVVVASKQSRESSRIWILDLYYSSRRKYTYHHFATTTYHFVTLKRGGGGGKKKAAAALTIAFILPRLLLLFYNNKQIVDGRTENGTTAALFYSDNLLRSCYKVFYYAPLYFFQN